MWVLSQSQQDSLEQEMATHSSILARRIPQTERSLTGYSPLGYKELDTTERLSTSAYCFKNRNIHTFPLYLSVMEPKYYLRSERPSIPYFRGQSNGLGFSALVNYGHNHSSDSFFNFKPIFKKKLSKVIPISYYHPKIGLILKERRQTHTPHLVIAGQTHMTDRYPQHCKIDCN